MKLDEDNIEVKMFDLFKTNNNWLEVYKELREEADKTERFSSIKSNLNPCFIYYMIKHKGDLEQFSNVMSHIYKGKVKPHEDKGLNRFFNTRDTDLGLAEYVKLDKFNNDESVWDNMAYLFLDFDKDKPLGKKILLDKNTLPYLLAMLNEVTEESVGALWYAGYHGFIRNFAYNPEDMKPLIEMALSNPAFDKSLIGEYSGFFNNLLRWVGDISYEKEVYPNQNKEIYKTLSKLIPDIDNVIAKALFRKDVRNDEPVKIDLGLLNFCLEIEPEIDIISKIDEKYKELYFESKLKYPGKSYQDLNEINKVSDSFHSSLTVSFEKHDFNLDCSKIDITKDFRENYIYLKLMEIKIRNKQNFDISQETAQYVVDLFEKEDKSDPMIEFLGINRTFKKEILVPHLKVLINYNEMDKSLEKKDKVKAKKIKV